MQELCSETRHKSVTWPTCSHVAASSHKADLQVPMQPLIVNYKSTDEGHCDPRRGRLSDARQAAWLHQGVCMEKRVPALCSGTRAGHSCLKAARRQTRSPCAPDALARFPAGAIGLCQGPTFHVRLSKPAKAKRMHKMCNQYPPCAQRAQGLHMRPQRDCYGNRHIPHHPS